MIISKDVSKYGFKVWGVEHRAVSHLLNGQEIFNCKMCNEYYTQGHGKKGFITTVKNIKLNVTKSKRI